MSIKSDKWIRKMAKEGMIEPFADKQVSKGVISFGVSSYGYDMRIADEFEIFTNVHSVVVDPKNFSKRSFVNFKGKECIIPPNSFALGKSVEYFRIPRNVLCIVLGKSTYARAGIIVNVTPLEPCYDKETEVLTKDGWKKFEDLKNDEIVATLNKNGELEYQKISAKQKIPFNGNLIGITGRNIDLLVTPSHMIYAKNRYKDEFEFIRADEIYGKYNYELKRDAVWKGKRKKYFTLPEVVKSLRFSVYYRTRKRIIDALKNKSSDSGELYEKTNPEIKYREFYKILSDLYKEGVIERKVAFKKRKVGANKTYIWSLRKEALKEIKDETTKPMKILMNDWLRFFGIWIAEGSAYVSKKGYIVKIAAFGKNKKIIEEWLKKLPFNYNITSTGFLINNKQLCLYLTQFGHAPNKFIPKEIKSLPKEQLKIFLDAYMLGDGNEETLTFTTTSEKLANDLQEIILKCSWAAIIRRVPKEKFKSGNLKGRRIKPNYDIFKVRIAKKQVTPKIYKSSFSKVPYNDYVYDVTVPNHTLYVRRNGKACWSSNCWQGYVTVEISNTTPLPVKVYANEGIAQVLFLESDEECETSYADKKGKYQNQTGIWLPKVEE